MYYNSAALLGMGRIKKRKSKSRKSKSKEGISTTTLSGMELVRKNVPVRKGSAAAKAKMAALRKLKKK